MSTVDVMHLRSAAEGGARRFDYKGRHTYLITLPTFRSQRIFTEEQKVLRLVTILRDIGWQHRFGIEAYCVLPDRLVMMAFGRSDASDMKAFLSAFREVSSNAFHAGLQGRLWKRTYTERVLRKTENAQSVVREIFNLPVKEGLALRAAEYSYQGSFVVRQNALPRSRGWSRPTLRRGRSGPRTTPRSGPPHGRSPGGGEKP